MNAYDGEEARGLTVDYRTFLRSKSQVTDMAGFEPLWLPDFLFDFQREVVEWSVRKGRAALFEDCGLGKTPQQLVWAQNVVQHTNRPVLILTPLAVSHQTVREAEKFGIDAVRSADGKWAGSAKIVVTNYERLHYFDASQFSGVVCDESSILKNFQGATKNAVTEFMRELPYRLLCTATAAPNDYVELGTSSEAIGELGYMDMLGMFFKNDQNTNKPMRDRNGHNHPGVQSAMSRDKWRFKPHAENDFWRWVCSWARSIRQPSDLGYDDGKFQLPELELRHHVVDASRPMPGMLFKMPAVGLREQLQERRHTITERCEKVAELVAAHQGPSVIWCHLNPEGDLLAKIIEGAVQVSGKDKDEAKEEKFDAFARGHVKKFVIKPKIGAFGLNWQHCAHMTFFPSNSFEQTYQGLRRCWRFGQQHKVVADFVSTEGEHNVMQNYQRKSDAADRMFDRIVQYMQDALRIEREEHFPKQEVIPAWL